MVSGKRVLLIWHGGNSTETIQQAVEDLRLKAGENGAVLLEHAERLLMGQSIKTNRHTKKMYFFGHSKPHSIVL